MRRLVYPVAALAVLTLLVTVVAIAATRLDGATVTNSGSTNTPGYMMKVRSDGTGSVQPKRVPQTAMPRRLIVSPGLATKLLDAAKAAKNASPAAQNCMKSASFGYRLTVTYHGWTSPDLTCPGGGPEMEALLAAVKQLEEAGNVDTGVRRIHLPVNEPRRLPTEGSPSPSPSTDRQP